MLLEPLHCLVPKHEDAARVPATLVVERLNNSVPSCVSSRLICELTADCVRLSERAARVNDS
jgi:hypothetical protein